MTKINCIPSYVFDPKYKMNYIIAMRMDYGIYLYQQCLGSKYAATKRLNQITEKYGNKFKMFSIDEVKQIQYGQK